MIYGTKRECIMCVSSSYDIDIDSFYAHLTPDDGHEEKSSKASNVVVG